MRDFNQGDPDEDDSLGPKSGMSRQQSLVSNGSNGIRGPAGASLAPDGPLARFATKKISNPHYKTRLCNNFLNGGQFSIEKTNVCNAVPISPSQGGKNHYPITFLTGVHSTGPEHRALSQSLTRNSFAEGSTDAKAVLAPDWF